MPLNKETKPKKKQTMAYICVCCVCVNSTLLSDNWYVHILGKEHLTFLKQKCNWLLHFYRDLLIEKCFTEIYILNFEIFIFLTFL